MIPVNMMTPSVQTQFHLCHYAVCHDEAEFVEADAFVPARWLRSSRHNRSSSQHHPFSFIPFGVGVRGCVGKRVAEMEMYFALSRVRECHQLNYTHQNLSVLQKLF